MPLFAKWRHDELLFSLRWTCIYFSLVYILWVGLSSTLIFLPCWQRLVCHAPSAFTVLFYPWFTWRKNFIDIQISCCRSMHEAVLRRALLVSCVSCCRSMQEAVLRRTLLVSCVSCCRSMQERVLRRALLVSCVRCCRSMHEAVLRRVLLVSCVSCCRSMQEAVLTRVLLVSCVSCCRSMHEAVLRHVLLVSCVWQTQRENEKYASSLVTFGANARSAVSYLSQIIAVGVIIYSYILK